jgi:restriction endonuclease S subunit
MLNHKKTYKLGDFLFEYSEKNTNGKVTEVYSVGSKGIRKRSEIYGHDLSANYQNYKIIFEKTLTIGMGSKQIDIGIFLEKIHGLVSPAYTTYKIENIKPEYLKNWFIQYTSKISQLYMITGARQGKSVNKVGLLSHPIKVPNYPEQEKIGSFLSAIDRLIEKQKEKVERIKSLKKGYLQKMFPLDNEDQPRLRFLGFQDRWVSFKLGDLGTVEMNKRIFKDQTSNQGEVPFYKIGTFGSEPDAFISRTLFEEYKKKFPYPSIGDILISASGSIGRIVEYEGKDEYFQDSNIVWLKHNNKVLNRFLKHFYSVVKWNGLEGSTIQRLYNKTILSTIIKLPGIEEQRVIASFFDGIEKLLINEESLFMKFEQFKKSYLQQIFAD